MQRRSLQFLAIGITSLLSLGDTLATAEIRADRVFTAEGRKTENYIRDGLIVGGDKAIDEVAIKDIRRAANPGGFERVVIDITPTQAGSAPAIPRAPFFQVAVTPDEKRVVFTMWGRPRLEFDAKKVLTAFKKSPVVRNIVLLPRVEEDSWTFAFELQPGKAVEVFELNNPVRITMDIKSKAK